MNEQLSQSQTENQQSDYDAEWGLEEDNSPAQSKAINHSEGSEKTPVEDPASEAGAQVANQETALDGGVSKPAEAESADIYAGMTEEQLAAIRKAERDEKAMEGRWRQEQDRASRLTRELEEERRRSQELAERAREPSQFEQDHPEYYQALKEEFGPKITESPALDPQEDAIEKILEAHADAGEVYNSPEFHAWIGQQPKYVRNTVDSSDPEDVISVLTSYKSQQPQAEPNEQQEQLQAVADVGGSSAQPDLRRPSELSDAELYDAEWEID